MTKRWHLLVALRHAWPEQWSEAGKTMAFTLFGTLLPVMLGMLVQRVNSTSLHWEDIANHGEFALYAAAIITPSIYYVVREGGALRFVHRAWFVLGGVGILVWSSGLFAALAALTLNQTVLFSIDFSFVRKWSFIGFVASVLYALVVQVVDLVRVNPDVAKLFGKEFSAFEKRFDRLEE